MIARVILWLLLTIACASAQVPMTGAGKATPGVVATTTWDPANKGAVVTLSGGNLTATLSGAGFASVRAIGSKASGKCFYQVSAFTIPSTVALGFVNGSFSISGGGFLGGTSDGLGWVDNGNVFLNNGGLGAINSFAAGDTISIAIDYTAQLFWGKVNTGNWNNSGGADPATGAGGISFAGVNAGPYYPAGMGGNTGDTWTANFGATSYSPAAPSGFGNC